MTINIYMYITNKCDLLSKNPAYIPNLKYCQNHKSFHLATDWIPKWSSI